MKTFAIWTIAAVIAGIAGVHGACLAGQAAQPVAANPIGALAGSIVPVAELTSQHGRGLTNIKVNDVTGGDGSSFDSGLVRGNAVIGTSATGMITTTNSVNNNAGITTVFQNSGNNSLFQQSTAINITVH